MSKLESVRKIVARTLFETGDEAPFTDDDSLLVSGRMNSLDVVNIVTALEDAFHFQMSADEFDPIRFDTITSIVELLGTAQPR